MAEQKSPLVIVNGRLTELQPGDSVTGAVFGSVTAASGLVGGGDLNTGSKRLDVALASNPSGLIFVGDALGYDGRAEATADTALASGLAALDTAQVALASGNAAIELADDALASGNAALENAVSAVNYVSSFDYITDSVLDYGDPVGINAAGHVQKIGTTVDADVQLTSTNILFGGTDNWSLTGFAWNNNTGQGIVSAAVTNNKLTGSNSNGLFYQPIVTQGGGFTLGTTYTQNGSGTTWYNSPVIANPGNGLFWGGMRTNTKNYSFGICVTSGDLDEFDISQTTVSVGKLIENQLKSSEVYRYFNYYFDDNQCSHVMTYASGNYNVINNTREFTMWGDSISSSSKTGLDNVQSSKQSRYQSCNASNASVAQITDSWTVFHKLAGSGIQMQRNSSENDYASYGYITALPGQEQTGNSVSSDYTMKIMVMYSGMYLSDPGLTSLQFGALKPLQIHGTYCDSQAKAVFVFEQDEISQDPIGMAMAYVQDGNPYEGNNSKVWAWDGPFQSVGSGGTLPHVEYIPEYDKLMVLYKNQNNYTAVNNYLVCNVVTPIPNANGSGTDIEVSPQYVLSSNSVDYLYTQYIDQIKSIGAVFRVNSLDQDQIISLSPPINGEAQVKNSLGQTNYLGVSTQAAASGDTVTIALPNSTCNEFSDLKPGCNYYINSMSGGFTTSSTVPPNWSGAAYTSFTEGQWKPVAKALSTSGMYLTSIL